MLKIRVYPACFDCDYCGFEIEQAFTSTYMYVDDENKFLTSSQEIKCKHEYVCKKIDGQDMIKFDLFMGGN